VRSAQDANHFQNGDNRINFMVSSDMNCKVLVHKIFMAFGLRVFFNLED